ncbi:hypothetical protein BB559_003629 [Furculomyces boomerangus]|uniref:60S ribosome subunit biogenesis protein NIP7 n=1 Tax=Furculomyces boomerangus TaxID=61424 RepID=A0A2T9YK49_9FUNG|nr:hypothetical protein BB559_003629 [Furculomyces boomerangus]
MRPLTEEETKIFFTKLSNYIGKNIALLIDRPDGLYCFRLHKDRVYYVREDIMKVAISIGKKNLISLGICFGKFTKTLKFRLHVTSLPYLAQYAKYKVWLKSNGVMTFLYGNHVLKAHVGKMSEDAPEHKGIVVMSLDDVPLGFGATAKSTPETRKMDPTGIVVYHQSDAGEYLRDEDTLF